MTTDALTRRKLLTRVGGGLALTTLGGSLLSACGGTSGSATGGSGAGAASKTLTVASTGGFQSLDPMSSVATANGPSMELIQALYGTLVNVNVPGELEAAKQAAATGALNGEPGLAESWESSADGKTWQFKLRKGAMSQAGNEFTSADVLWTAERGMAEPTMLPVFLFGLAGITDPKQITAPDANTIEMKMPAAPPPFFLQVLATAYMSMLDSVELKKHVTADDPWAAKWLVANAAGHGQFKLDSAEINKSATLGPNPGYWGEKPGYTEILQQGVTEQSSRLQLVITGNAQYTQELTPLQLEQGEKQGQSVRNFTTTRVAFLVLDTKVKPFDSLEVRQAIARAIPYDEIIKTVYRGFAQPWKSAYAPWLQGSTDEFWDYATDAEAARAVLGSIKTPIKLYYVKNFGSGQQISVIVQQALKAIGMNVQLEGLLQAVSEKRKQAGELPFFLDDSDSPVVPHALYHMKLFYTKDAFQNMAHYDNPELDELCVELAGTQDIDAQNVLIRRANEMMMRDVPYVPIAYTGTTGISQKSVAGVQATISSLVDYGHMRPA